MVAVVAGSTRGSTPSRSLLRLVVASVAVVLTSALSWWHGDASTSPASFVTFHLALVALLLAGALLLHTDGQRANGHLMLAIATLGAIQDAFSTLSGLGPAAFLAQPVYWVYAAAFGHLLLRWPDDRVRGWLSRALLASVYGVLPLITIAWQSTWEPRWFGPVPAGEWWPVLVPDRPFAVADYLVGQYLYLATVLAFLAVIGIRTARADPERRRRLLPVICAGVALGAAVIVGALSNLGVAIPVDITLLQNLAMLAVPAAVLAQGIGTTPLSPHDAAEFARLRQWYRSIVALLGVAVLLIAVAVITSVASTSADVPAPAVLVGPSAIG